MTHEAKPPTVLQYLRDMSTACGGFHSIEKRPEKASGSELRRWIQQSAVVISGQVMRDPNAEIDLPVTSFVLFPKSKERKTTLL